jgi:acetolactate synthase-1/2/3 large subunit
MTDVSAQRARSAQRVVEVLTAYGVDYVFGVPGAKIDAVFDALADAGPQVVVCRHEQNAAFMAGAAELHLSLPRTADFLAANLAKGDMTEQIRQTEGGH